MPSGLTEAEEVRRASIVKKRPTLTGVELGRLVRPGKKVNPKKWMIWRALRKLGYSRKKVSFEVDEKSRPDVKERYRKFKKKAKRTDSVRLVFLDETGIKRSEKVTTAWARLGEHALLTRPGTGARRSHTVMGAMRASGLVGMRSLRGSIKKSNFLSFLSNVVCPRLKAGDIVVMDNLSSHRSSEAIFLVRGRGVSVALLPPYSPELNPIELLWSTLKKRLAKRLGEAVTAIGRAIGGAWRSLKNTVLQRLLPACGYPEAIQC